MSTARRAQADDAAIIGELRRMGPNRRAMERTARRIRRAPGVILAGISGRRVVVVLRSVCSALTRRDGMDAYSEDVLMYLRVSISSSRKRVSMAINGASFCLHALERLIERSSCEMKDGFLGVVDAEAALLLKRTVDGGSFEQDEDQYVAAKQEGVWAGSLDTAVPGPDWNLGMDLTQVPTFSVRTFLGADQMKPTVWLRWRSDPRLSLAA